MMSCPHLTSYSTWLADKLSGKRWCVAPRLTPRLASKGYEIAISQAKFRKLGIEHRDSLLSQWSLMDDIERIALALTFAPFASADPNHHVRDAKEMHAAGFTVRFNPKG